MIYERVEPASPIQQGDIFRDVPRIDISLQDLTVLERTEENASFQALSWLDAIDTEGELVPSATDEEQPFLRALLPVSRVCAIVITQNCDALRAEDLSLCEIAPLSQLNRSFANVTSPKRLSQMLTKQDSENVRWFYLPPDALMPFQERMGVDFRSVLRLPRVHLATMSELRVGRLNPLAYDHFREKLASFFRRYAYDAWYPLNKEEFEAYRSDYPDIAPFPWQR
jgi:hypothetical protein